MLIPQLTWEELFRCSHSALWVMTLTMGHSLEVCVPSVGFGASFHFTNDLNFFESWVFHFFLSVSSRTAVQEQRLRPVFLTADITLCFHIVIFAGVFVIL